VIGIDGTLHNRSCDQLFFEVIAEKVLNTCLTLALLHFGQVTRRLPCSLIGSTRSKLLPQR
jgi:hypothetical protein